MEKVLQFAPGQTDKMVTVIIPGILKGEPMKNFKLNLEIPADSDGRLGRNDSALVNVWKDYGGGVETPDTYEIIGTVRIIGSVVQSVMAVAPDNKVFCYSS